MLAILNSAFAAAMRWLVQGAGLITLVTTALGFVLTAAVGLILPLIPGVDSVGRIVSSIPGGVMWILALFNVPICLTIAFGFLVARFTLRRIPFIG